MDHLNQHRCGYELILVSGSYYLNMNAVNYLNTKVLRMTFMSK